MPAKRQGISKRNRKKSSRLCKIFLYRRLLHIFEAVKGSITLSEEEKEVFLSFADNFVQYAPYFSSQERDQFIEVIAMAGKPYGILLPTFSPHIEVLLLPYRIDLTGEFTEEDREEFCRGCTDEEWEELKAELNRQSSQTIVFHDGRNAVRMSATELTANYLFIASMSKASVEGKYPHDKGDISPEFKECLAEAFRLVAHYVQGLSREEVEKLPAYLRKVSLATDGGFGALTFYRFASEFAFYQCQTATAFLDDSWSDEVERTLNSVEALAQGETYLHCEERNLFLRARRDRNSIPNPPWVEYCSNRWSFKHKIYGRYEWRAEDRLLRVDYLLDSTHIPGRYGFFSKLEIVEETWVGRQHIVLGQEFYRKHEMFLTFLAMGMVAKEDGSPLTPEEKDEETKGVVIPVVSAGSFDFLEPVSRQLLQDLANDPAAKQDIARVIKDTLEFAADGTLLTAKQWAEVAKKEAEEMRRESMKN
ncbi:MAG: hypothetical protein WD231_03040 [Candidatus Woykebacteria bacterium]